MDWASRPC